METIKPGEAFIRIKNYLDEFVAGKLSKFKEEFVIKSWNLIISPSWTDKSNKGNISLPVIRFTRPRLFLGHSGNYFEMVFKKGSKRLTFTLSGKKLLGRNIAKIEMYVNEKQRRASLSIESNSFTFHF